MILFHGSNIEVTEPRLIRTQRNLDFGKGFYTTSDFGQAAQWALRTTRIRQDGRAQVSTYEVDDMAFSSLNVLTFPKADVDWLRYVTQHRKSMSVANEYDVVVGPVANDQTIRTINDYIRGRFPEDIAIRLLKPQRLKDQHVFKTQRALRILSFKEVIHI